MWIGLSRALSLFLVLLLCSSLAFGADVVMTQEQFNELERIYSELQTQVATLDRRLSERETQLAMLQARHTETVNSYTALQKTLVDLDVSYKKLKTETRFNSNLRLMIEVGAAFLVFGGGFALGKLPDFNMSTLK